MSTSTTILPYRKQPNYTTENVTLHFGSEQEYQEWFNSEASTHCNWNIKGNFSHISDDSVKCTLKLVCDHYGAPRTRQSSNPSTVKRKRTQESIKVNCTARILKHHMDDDSVVVDYKWIHTNHNPADIDDYIRSRLHIDIQDWIKKHVDLHMDWKTIKSLLRLNAQELDELENNVGGRTYFPPRLLIKHQDVKNVIYRKLNQLARKHPVDRTSVRLWFDYLKSKDYTTFFNENHGGPFVVSWFCPWQKTVS
ncbi:unnamed protein product [Absidia cylindrospora]